jgi:hypothetical protein
MVTSAKTKEREPNCKRSGVCAAVGTRLCKLVRSVCPRRCKVHSSESLYPLRTDANLQWCSGCRAQWGLLGRSAVTSQAHFKKKRAGEVHWVPVLTPVIPATQEAEIRRIEVQSQRGQIVHETLSWKNPYHKKRLVE